MRTALAMVQTALERLEPRDIPLPELGADDALLRVEACGIPRRAASPRCDP